MTFLILITFNFIFCLCVFLYFRERMNRVTSGEAWKEEMTALITLFNRNADEQIQVLDDRIRQIRELQASLSSDFVENKKREISAPRAAVTPASPTEARSPLRDTPKVETLSIPKSNLQEEVIVSESDPYRRQDRLKDYLEQKGDEVFEQLNLSEKIRFLHRRQQPEQAIARKLGVSLMEIRLALQPR